MNWQMGRRRAAPAVQVAPAVVIGSAVQAACSKCKAMTPHVILAKVGVKPTRVECVTCKDAHPFKPAIVRRSPVTAGMSPQEAWAASMRHARGVSTPYSSSGRYAVGARVSHPSFGDGVVAKLTSTTVCEVLFSVRTVKLIMGTAPREERLGGDRQRPVTGRPGEGRPRQRVRHS